jgi:lipoyl(octanoyl) transferase
LDKNNKIFVNDLGLCSYKKAWEIQENLLGQIIDQKLENRKNKNPLGTNNYILFVEHNPVITMGKSGDNKNLITNKKYLEELQIEYFKTNRGGDITFHGPGQIVVYPILDLENFFTDIHKYLRLLEETVILTIKEFNLNSARSSGETGVWIDPETKYARKICSIGVKASRWVTMHGFALNVNTDLDYFNHIVPCGIKGKKVTSIKNELKKEISIDKVKVIIKKNFEKLFDAKLEGNNHFIS